MEFQLPAVCRECHSIGPSGYVVADQGTMHIMNCTARCQGCGGVADVPNGVHTIINDVLRWSADYDLSREDLVRAVEAVDEHMAASGQMDVVSLAAAIEKKSPAVAVFVRRVASDLPVNIAASAVTAGLIYGLDELVRRLA